jgi:hypothetical protein
MTMTTMTTTMMMMMMMMTTTTAAILVYLTSVRDFVFTLLIRKFGLVDDIGKDVWKSLKSKDM